MLAMDPRNPLTTMISQSDVDPKSLEVRRRGQLVRE